MSLVYILCQDGRILGVKGNEIAFFSLLSSTSCRPMTFGEVGCFLSHYFIWLRIIAEDMSTVLILEDDIDFQHYKYIYNVENNIFNIKNNIYNIYIL